MNPDTIELQPDQDATEVRARKQNPEAMFKKYHKQINAILTSKAESNFREIGRKIISIYRNAGGMSPMVSANISPQRTLYNILWSNVRVLSPSLFARIPKIVCERRFKDSDPIGRLSTQLVERATSFTISSQQDRFMCAVRGAVEDRLLPGRGNVWLRYKVDMQEIRNEDGPVLDESGNYVKQAIPGSEHVEIMPLCWLDYIHNQARNPFEITLQARRCYMTRDELVENFGDIGKEVSLGDDPSSQQRAKLNYEEFEFEDQAEVWEIWDESCKKVVFISPGYDKGPLKVEDNPLRLKDFFPCPRPLLATTTTDSLTPTADYKIYEGLADELDFTLKRISSMTECVKLVGAAAASLNEVFKGLMRLEDGQLLPVQNWAQFVGEKGGLDGAISWFPFDRALQAIEALQNRAEYLKSQIAEITGINDVVRGASDPTETLGAQQLKSHWTVAKISEAQADVQRFCREIIGKIAEIIFEPGLFADDTIKLMCGVEQMPIEDQQLFPQALALLRSDRLRTFRVDIETDSTIAVDEDQDKQARMEYINAVNSLFGSVANIAQFRPELMQPMIESAMFAIRSFRTGKALEQAWERAIQQIEDNDQAAAENPQPPPPDYESQKLQIEMQKVQQDGQAKAQELNIKNQELQLKIQQLQNDFQIESQKLAIEQQKVMTDAEIDQAETELKKFQQDFTQFVETQKLELEKSRVILTEKEKLLEEARLQQQQQFEEIRHFERMASQGMPARKTPEIVKLELAAAEAEAAKRKEEESKPKKRTMKVVEISRGMDGKLRGVAREVDEPDEVEQ